MVRTLAGALAAALLIAASLAAAQNYTGAGQTPHGSPYTITDYAGNSSFVSPVTNTSGYTSQACSTTHSKVVVVFGQSLFANSTNDVYTVTNPTKVLNFNIFDGLCYQAKNILLGATGGGGNPLSRVGDNLITGGATGVIIVPAVVGGSWVASWSTPGLTPYLYNNIATTFKRLTAAGLTATEIVWAQGETDTSLGTSQVAYAASLTTILAGIRSVWPTTPILINSAETMISSATSATVAAAQAAAIDNVTIFAGANTDTVGAGSRYDGTHFTAAGSASAASLLSTAIAAH